MKHNLIKTVLILVWLVSLTACSAWQKHDTGEETRLKSPCSCFDAKDNSVKQG